MHEAVANIRRLPRQQEVHVAPPKQCTTCFCGWWTWALLDKSVRVAVVEQSQPAVGRSAALIRKVGALVNREMCRPMHMAGPYFRVPYRHSCLEP